MLINLQKHTIFPMKNSFFSPLVQKYNARKTSHIQNVIILAPSIITGMIGIYVASEFFSKSTCVYTYEMLCIIYCILCPQIFDYCLTFHCGSEGL